MVFCYLRGRRGYPNAVIDGISENALEHVALAVNLSGVDLVKESHHHERVEDDGEVLRRCCGVRLVSTRIDIQKLFTWKTGCVFHAF